MKDLGRADYMPKLKIWKAFYYVGPTDHHIGNYETSTEAYEAIQRVHKLAKAQQAFYKYVKENL